MHYMHVRSSEGQHSAMTPQDLKDAVPRGMLSFPLTDFDANGDFD